jgi:hypothetical protein
MRGAADEPVDYVWDDLRFSVSWKAYCFADEAERAAWAEHADDLSLEVILDRLEEDLRETGRLDGARPDPRDFAAMLIRTYIRFPEPASA